MAIKLGNYMIGLLIFAGMVALYISAYYGMIDTYNLTPTDTIDGMSVMEKINNIGLIRSVNATATSLTAVISFFESPSLKESFDLIGGFLGLGIGSLRTAASLPSFPAEIIGIVTEFYYIPPIIATIINIIAITAFGIIIFNILTGSNN